MPIRTAFVLLLYLCAQLCAQTYEFTTIHLFEPHQTITAIAAADDGTVYFANHNPSYIGKRSPDGTVSIIAGSTDSSGSTGFVGGPGSTARFRMPEGLWLDPSGNLLVADTWNNALRKISPDGVVTTLAGRGEGESGRTDGAARDATFYLPRGITSDASGNIFVLDTGNRLLRRLAPDGIVSTVTGGYSSPSGAAEFLPRDGTGSQVLLLEPRGIVPGRAGGLFIADGTHLREVSSGGSVSTIAGGGLGYEGAGAGVQLYTHHLAYDRRGTLYFTHDTVIRAYSVEDGRVRTLAGQFGQPATVDGRGGSARFSTPKAIACNAAGHLFVVDGRALRRGASVSLPAPPIIFTPPFGAGTSRNVGANTRLELAVEVGGAAPLTYQWSRNGLPIAGATASTLVFPSVSVSDEGSYAVTVANPYGSVTSQPVALSVFTPQLTSFSPRHATAGGSFLWSIAGGAGQLVAVGTGGTILSSTDGRTWTRRNSGTTLWLVGITYAQGKFVAVGDGGLILLSSDGVAWSRARASGTTQRLNNVVFARDLFVAVGEGGVIVTSPDAQTWTARLSGVTAWLRGLTYEPYRVSYQIGSNGSAQFYASGQGGVLLSSYDGLSWSKESSILSQDIEALAQGVGGVGQDGTIARQSTVVYGPAILVGKGSPTNNSVTEYYMNIVLWSRFNIGIPARFRGLARGAGAVFAMGENGAIAAASDYNGPWATLASGTSDNLVGAVFYNDTLYIVGENESILASDTIYPSRLANLSTRGRVTGESETLIAGFVIRGPEKKRVLLRVAGPALGALGVPGSLARAALTLRDQAGRSLGTNAGWGSGDAEAIRLAALQAGAFPFAAGSADAALLVTLDPGNYTAEVSGVGGAAGVALVEAYDLDPGSQTERKLINLSTRGNVGTDADKLIAGFVITGADSRRVLIRAIGPTLEAFGVPRALAEPKLELFNSRAQLQRVGETWSLAREPGALRTAATATGAFALADDSRDAALVATLPPGAYTVQVSGTGGATGAALVEIYEVP